MMSIQASAIAAQLSSVLVERAFSHPDVSCFRAEADQSSDHHRHHSGNPRRAPNCSRGPFARR